MEEAEEGEEAAATTAKVADVRSTPLGQLAGQGSGTVRRIVHVVGTPKAPVATFDAAL